MSDLIVASNRGPLSFESDGDGRPVLAGSGGGLAGTLRPLLVGTGATWVASSMSEADRLASAEGLMAEPGLAIVTVEVDPDTYRMAYDVVANATLWFCHHHLFDLPRRPRFDRHWATAWDAYRRLNQQFADAVAEVADEGARVLVQDYHLALVGSMLAAARPDLRTVHFTHTPFADPNALRVLPGAVAGELLAGLAGFGACGFHTARWEAAFRAAYADPDLVDGGRASAPRRTLVAPLGPTPRPWPTRGGHPVAEAGRELDELVAGRRLVLRVDRVELSKNLLRGFWAFEELLENRPELEGRVVMLALAYPSREGLADYLSYRTEVEHTVERINERFAGRGPNPVVLDVADDRARSVAALARYDVLLVNPIRDGMNLVAKEGPVVNATDGVVVLSREAGAWAELHEAVVGVNPFDVTGTAAALDRALQMDPAERAGRAGRLRQLVAARPAADWLTDLLAAAGPPLSWSRGRRASAGQQLEQVEGAPGAPRPPGRRPRPPRAGSRRRPRPPGPRPSRLRPARPAPRKPGGRPGRHRSRRPPRAPAPVAAPPCPCRPPPAGAARGPSGRAGPPARCGRRRLGEGPAQVSGPSGDRRR